MKKTPIIIAMFLAMVMAFTACGSNAASESSTTGTSTTETSAQTSTVEYATKLFDNSYVHTINVEISDDDWDDLTANPLDKTKYEVNITIDGETVSDVSFSTKGNTSLSSVAEEDSDRYSFKVNFGKYVDDQTYYGLNKLNLQNIYADATYMKDYISYEIFREVGVDAPLTSYVSLSINGELFGLYLAIEDISESYLTRTTNGEGVLYKPETESLAGMDEIGNFDMGDMELPEGMEDFDPENMTMPDDTQMPSDGTMPQNGDAAAQNQNGGTGTDADNSNQEDNGNNSNTNVQPNGDAATQNQNGGNGTTAENGNQTGDDESAQTTNPGGMQMPENMELPEGFELPEGMEDFDPENMTMPGGMDFGSDSNGANLKYTDDELSSYTDIFDNAETDADEDDNRRVIASLKGLSESTGSELENYIDTDEVIRYFVAHNFVMNYDSYTGTMLHNYYLYENNGILSMLPWDYNLAFGSFMGQGQDASTMNFEMPQDANSDVSENETTEPDKNAASETSETTANESLTTNEEDTSGKTFSLEDMNMVTISSATDIVNYDIDSPLSGATEENRPMWSWIVNNEEYLEKYHEIFDSLITDYFESGKFATEMERVYNMIRPYVEEDPSAFYTVDEFDTAYDTLLKFCNLRAESIRKQLNGEEADVDASDIDISTMGTHMNDAGAMGNQGGGMTFPGGMENFEGTMPQDGMSNPNDEMKGTDGQTPTMPETADTSNNETGSENIN